MSALPVTEPTPRHGTTRERLLEAAIEMFAERGYAATGVDALCRKAGVAKTGLYWEFQNKVGLLNAVIDQVVAEWIDQIRDAARGGGGARDRLEAALSTMRRRVQERPELFRVLLVVLAERSQIDEESREALRRFHASALNSLLAGIQEALPSSLPLEALKETCELILAMIVGVFIRQQIYGEADLDRIFAAMQSTILRMIGELALRSPPANSETAGSEVAASGAASPSVVPDAPLSRETLKPTS